MSLRLEMLQVARLAPRVLGDSAGLVKDFLIRQQNEDGGFKDRTGRSDLYYTVFGLDGLIALQADLQADERAMRDLAGVLAKAKDFLRSFGEGEGLDFVHLCCLARGWTAVANLAHQTDAAAWPKEGMLRRLGSFRSRDGGFNPVAGNAQGTAYGAFLAFGAHQD